MDFNDFIKKCKEKYTKYGVTMINVSVWDDVLSIYLTRPEGDDSEKNPDTIYVGIEPDDGEDIPICYAHYKGNMPFNEHEVFYWLDEWFKDKKDYVG